MSESSKTWFIMGKTSRFPSSAHEKFSLMKICFIGKINIQTFKTNSAYFNSGTQSLSNTSGRNKRVRFRIGALHLCKDTCGLYSKHILTIVNDICTINV